MLRRFWIRLKPGADRVETALAALEGYDFLNAQYYNTGYRHSGSPAQAKEELLSDIVMFEHELANISPRNESNRSYFEEKIEELKGTKLMMIRIESINKVYTLEEIDRMYKQDDTQDQKEEVLKKMEYLEHCLNKAHSSDNFGSVNSDTMNHNVRAAFDVVLNYIKKE